MKLLADLSSTSIWHCALEQHTDGQCTICEVV